MSVTAGTKVAYRASALGLALDPKAHWRGVLGPVGKDSWVPVTWTLPDGSTRETWESRDLLAVVDSLAFRDPTYRGTTCLQIIE